MEDRVLFVDDDTRLLDAYRRQLRKVLKVETADSPRKALQLISDWGPFSVVIADMYMPGMDGIAFLSRVKEIAPNTVRMMLTGAPDLSTATDAVNEGSIFRFLTKPCQPDVMAKSLIAAINQYRLITAEKELLESTLNGAIELVTEILSLVNPEGFGHAMQLRSAARSVAKKMALESVWEIELAALLARIGNIAVPVHVLNKMHSNTPLTPTEQGLLDRVPEISHDLLQHIPRLEHVAEVIRYQHKHYDGTGYPDGDLKGNDIPIGARLLKVVIDMLELWIQGKGKSEATRILHTRQGWYDPRILAIAPEFYPQCGSDMLEMESTRTIASEELTTDMVLASDVETSDKRLLIRAGSTITPTVLARIRSYSRLIGLKEPVEIYSN